MNSTLASNPRYDLQQRLGEGGMGIVYAAYDRLQDTHVALKLVHADPSSLAFNTIGSNATLALSQEFRVLAGLRHPHIVSVLDYGFDAEQNPYYTMELLDGAQTLIEYAKTQDRATIIELMIDVLQALVYLHRRGIIHRDLKPSNILVAPGHGVKVVDFGLALQIDPSNPPAADDQLNGTLMYMAPELLAGGSPSVASDLHAVGLILCELLTGVHPYADNTVLGVMERILHDTVDLNSVPDNLAPIVGRLLAKDPAARYHTAADVIRALYEAFDTPLPAESPLLRESFLQSSAFVGRDAELAQLIDALQSAQNGTGSVWLIGGESGVGKSRLLDELRSHALVAGFLVLGGQGVANGGRAYELWRDVLPRLVLDTQLNDFEAGVLKAIVPDISRLVGRHIDDAPDILGHAEQQRLVDVIRAVFKRQNRPILLILEDLQWTSKSLVPLHALIKELDELGPMMIIGSYRDDERPNLPQELPDTKLLKLPRLNESATAQLASSILGDAGRDAGIVALLQRETEGNAFFMVETVRALADYAGSLDAIGTRTLPANVMAGGVQQVIERRLALIPAHLSPLLAWVAVAGRQLDLDLINANVGSGNVQALLEAGGAANVLEAHNGTWRFTHDKLREAVLARLSDDDRREAHGIVATWIEQTYPNRREYNEVLLEHWHRAANLDRELRYLNIVAHNLTEKAVDHPQAMLLLNRTLHKLTPDDPRRVKLLNWLALSYNVQGDQLTTMRYANEAHRIAAAHGDKAGMATSLNMMGRATSDMGDTPKAFDLYHRSLALARDIGDRNEEGLNLICLGEAARTVYQLDDAQRYHQAAYDIFDELGGVFGKSIALHNLGAVNLQLGRLAVAKQQLEDARTLSESIGDLHTVAVANNNLGFIARQEDDLERSRELQLAGLSYLIRIGDQFNTTGCYADLGQLELEAGNLDAAEDYFKQSLAIAEGLDVKMIKIWPLLGLGRLARQRGDFARAADYAVQGLAHATEIDHAVLRAEALHDQAALAIERDDADALAVLKTALDSAISADPIVLLQDVLLWAIRGLIRAEKLVAAATIIGYLRAQSTTFPLTKRHLDTLYESAASELATDSLQAALIHGATLDIDGIRALLDFWI